MIYTLPQDQTAHSKRPAFGPAMLRARGLGLAFGRNRIFADVNLDLHQGECVLLAGENGAGKTTLINILTGNFAPTSGKIHYAANGQDRSFSFPSHWWSDLNPWNHFRPEFVAKAGIGRSWQDVRLFGSLSLKENLEVAATSGLVESPLAAVGFLACPNSTSTVLADLGLEGREDSSADMISFGQSKRVAIARAIAAGAKVLFLDEPLSGLDRDGIDSVVKYLRRLIEEHQLTLVIVEHVFHQHHLLPLVTTRWELKNGTLTSQPAISIPTSGNVVQDDWIKALISAGSSLIQQELPRHARLTRIQVGSRSTYSPVLEIKDLAIMLGKRQVLGVGDNGESSPLSLTVSCGEIAILEAPNGWGKTSLFKVLAGQIKPTTGSWTVQGIIPSPGDGLVNCVPSSASLFPSLTVREVAVIAGRQLTPHFDSFSRRKCSSLSGGERQRLALALSSPGILHVYDEPFNGLDRWQETVSFFIKHSQAKHGVLIMVPKTLDSTGVSK